MTSSIEELQSIIESNSKNINEGELMMRETMTGSRTAVSHMNDLKVAHEEINDNSKKIEKSLRLLMILLSKQIFLRLIAVEARAGEAGRGFAVVADQVKNLAEKSANAAKETSALIETSIEGVEKGYNLGEDVSESLNKAVELAEKVAILLDEVNTSSREQLQGATQVTMGISQINTVVQQTASSSEETAAAGEELLSQADVTKTIVTRLNAIVTGKYEQVDLQKEPIIKQNNVIRQIEQPKYFNKPNSFASSHKPDEPSPESQIPFDEF